MAKCESNSHSYASNFAQGPVSDEDLIRGFLVDLGASGRAARTAEIYGDPISRHWSTSLHRAGNVPGWVHVRYRAVNRTFRWIVAEHERTDNTSPKSMNSPPASLQITMRH